MNKLQEILKKLNPSATSFEMSPRDYEQFKVDGLNEAVGTRHLEDGYECSLCKNKGFIAKLVENEDGTYSHCFAPCKCDEIRKSIIRLNKSGLKNIIKDYKFSNFEDTEPWQKVIKEAAMEYAKNPEGWFFLGGQSGSGKTHLCCAICREFIYAGKSLQYFMWRDDIVKIKAAVTDSEVYSGLMEKYKQCDVLYIDDLFKMGMSKDDVVKPTTADINVAFEIINYRYNNPNLLTIISSELSEDELVDIDEAIGGRIYERAKAFTISKDRSRNYRIKKAVKL